MKKRLTLFSLLLLFTMTAMAQTLVDGICYNLNGSENTAEVIKKTDGTKYSGDIVIPASISVDGVDYSVTSIGDDAFYDCSGLTSIEIPNSVTSIGERAFEECSRLTSIEIPNSVTEIGERAFFWCSGLTSIKIPNSVTAIGIQAFSQCSGLTSIEIPNSVTSIGYMAFSSCDGLTSIEIPNSVTEIGEYAFRGCSGLTSIVVEEGNSYYDSRENCNALIETSSNTLLAGCQNTVIPTSVTSIGEYAFKECSSLTSIEIPNSVTEIGGSAFFNCDGLTSIEIPTSVTEIGESAFAFCDGLTSIEIPASVTSIGDWAFNGCSGLTSIEIPNSVTSIGERAFAECSRLTSIEIPNSVTEIGVKAFQFCEGLTSIVVEEGNSYYDSRENCNALIETASNKLIVGCQNTVIPTSVTSIGELAFASCSGLTSIEIPTSVTSIGARAFQSCEGLTSIEIPNSVTSIEDQAFFWCSGLTSIKIPNSVTEIRMEAFRGCSSLTSIEIPNSVTEIGSWAFNGCSSLTSIEIPNSVTSIGDDAFRGCSGLTSITMQRATPPTTEGENLFNYCSKLETIYVPAGAVEAYNVAPWNAYNIVESAPEIPDDTTNYESRHNGTKTRSDRNVTAVKLTGEYSGEQVYTLTSAEQNKDYSDVTDSVVFKVVSGETLTPVVDHEYIKNIGSWMHHAVYIDTDRNGFTGAIAEGSEWKPAGDLVTYSFYNNGAESDVSGWNSVGETISGDNRHTLPIPAFTAPTEPGIYRMRFVQDWCSIDPAGDADGKFGDFKENGGQIVDVMLEVVEGTADPEPEVPATPNAVLKLTFDRSGDNVSVSVAGLEGVTASVVSKSHAWKDLSVTNANTILCPNVNGNTDPTITWGIQLNGVPANYKLQGMALDIHALNSSGNYQYPEDGVNRHWNVAVAQGETLLANFADIEISQGTENGRIGNNHKVHSVAAVEALAATDPMTLNFTITKGSENAGCFFGLSEVTLTYKVADYVFLTDGEAYTNATEKETEGIVYTREFKNTQWQSWYVPFDMDYNDISDEYTAACLNDIHEYDDDEDGVLDRWTMEVLILRPGETMYANLPYVIRAKEVGEKQFVVENTMLYPADEQSMDCSSMRMHYTFTGTYSPIEAQVLRDNGWLAMGNGRLVTPTTTSTLKANRWYLESTPRKGYGSTYQAPKRIELVVVDENGEVTDVEELPLTEDENAVWPADVYDLNGRLVKAQAKNLEDLPKGVYVVNGQKWVK